MKTWGELIKEEKLAILEAFLDGKELESFRLYYENEVLVRGWQPTSPGLWWDDIPVRVKGE